MRFPILITNAKNYACSVGGRADELLAVHEKVARETGKSLALALNPIDLGRLASKASISLCAQHVDGIDFGSHTGCVHPLSVVQSGVGMTLLNHSEHRLDQGAVETHLRVAFEAGLEVVLCAESEAEVETFAELYHSFQPAGTGSISDFAIAYEPPELIGSSDKSVTSENPEIIRRSVDLARDIPLIVGAGINAPEDITTALALGAQGFLVASSICKSETPEVKIRELLAALS